MKIEIILKKYILLILCLISISGYAHEADDSIRQKKQEINKLKELNVETSNIRQVGENTIVNITKSMRKGTVTTEQMLGNIPGFFYDPNTGVKYNGSDNFMLLMDSIEKPKSMIYELNNIKFDKIVIVPQPQGEYSGYDYLINIKTRPNYEGYEGNIYALYNQYFNDDARKGVASLKPSTYAYYTKNKVTLYGNANMSWSHTAYNFSESKSLLFDDRFEEVRPNQNGKKIQDNLGYTINTRMMADYQFNPKNTLSIQYSYSFNPSFPRVAYEKYIRDSSHPGGETYPYNTWRDTYVNRHAASAFYRNYMNRVKFNANVQYSFDNINQTYKVKQGGSEEFGYHYRNRMNLILWNMSANTILGKNTSIFWGYNGTYKGYSQINLETEADLSSNQYIRNKLYFGFTQPIGKKLRLSLSPSIEFIQSKSDGKNFNQTPFGATGFIYYNISRKVWVRFDYEMNTQYPNQNDAADWGYFTDPYIWEGGNPALKSSIFHNLWLQTNFFNCLNIRAGYSINPDAIYRIGKVDEGMLPSGEYGKYLAYRPFNGKYEAIFGQVSFSKPLNKYFSLNSSYRISHTYVDVSNVCNSGYSHRFAVTGRYNNTIHGFNVWFTYVLYNPTNISPQVTSRQFMENPYITISKFLCNKKMQLSLVYGSFFHLFGDSYTKGRQNIGDVYKNNFFTPYWERNKIEFTFTYRFWGGKSVKAYEKGISEEI